MNPTTKEFLKRSVAEPKVVTLSFWLQDKTTGFQWKVEREFPADQPIDMQKVYLEEVDKYAWYKENKSELDEKFGEYGAWRSYEERRGNSGGEKRVQPKDGDLR